MTENEKLQYDKALEYATKMHEGQFRIGGDPYISHPIAVSNIVKEKGFGIEYQITGLFHDLLEDTSATEEEIEKLGGKDVLTAVKLLTKQKGYVMGEYISAIKGHPIAFAVKSADRLHNLRSAFKASEDFKRRYLLETLDWFMDFDKEIPKAVRELANSMNKPIKDLPLEYEFVNNWLK